MKLILGAILAGLAMLLWGAVSHMLLPLGTGGFGEVPKDKEAAVIQSLKGALSERAIYMFPILPSDKATEEQMKAYQAKVAVGPSGLIVYTPGAVSTSFPRYLALEFAFNALASLFAGFALLHVSASVSYVRRVLIVAGFGAFAALAIDASYWNWYHFPTSYFGAQIADAVVGAFLAGLVLAGFCKCPSTRA